MFILFIPLEHKPRRFFNRVVVVVVFVVIFVVVFVVESVVVNELNRLRLR